ncbi:MAG: phosphotransferase [Bdellovibrionota bacterium]
MLNESDRERFYNVFPSGFFIDSQNYLGLEVHLKRRSLLLADDRITHVESAGDGNMNLTLRVSLETGRTFIVKQSRPWCEKYPQIRAPATRTQTEAKFYSLLASDELLSSMTPQILDFDGLSGILSVQDLVNAKDCSVIYIEKSFNSAAIRKLAAYLSRVHAKFTVSPRLERLANLEMRALNHEYIFLQPFSRAAAESLISRDPDLIDFAENSIWADRGLSTAAARLGSDYLSKGDALVHGDFFPGAWMARGSELFVIDPEFAFHGQLEFDLGVVEAHFFLAGLPPASMELFFSLYEGDYDRDQVSRYCGTEVIRRLIGLAGVPVSLTIFQKESLLKGAIESLKQ